MAYRGYVPGPEFERVFRGAEDQMAKVKELKARMADVVGRGEAADGRVSAEFKKDGGLTVLDLDPRVMRLPAAELSLEIRAAVNAAAQDYQTKISEVGEELFGGTEQGAATMADPKVALAEVEKLGEGFATQMKDVLRELTVQQRRARDAIEQLRDPRQGR